MQSFDEMFALYFGRVYRFALSLTRSTALAEDITQQTFFKALKKIESFEGRSDPGTWLCSIAKNEYFSLRKRGREQAEPPDSTLFMGRAADAAEHAENEATLMQIHRHLHELEEPYREVFMLRVFGELKYAQIGSLFGKKDSWARVIYYRAKLKLQEKIKEDEGGQADV